MNFGYFAFALSNLSFAPALFLDFTLVYIDYIHTIEFVTITITGSLIYSDVFAVYDVYIHVHLQSDTKVEDIEIPLFSILRFLLFLYIIRNSNLDKIIWIVRHKWYIESLFSWRKYYTFLRLGNITVSFLQQRAIKIYNKLALQARSISQSLSRCFSDIEGRLWPSTK